MSPESFARKREGDYETSFGFSKNSYGLKKTSREDEGVLLLNHAVGLSVS